MENASIEIWTEQGRKPSENIQRMEDLFQVLTLLCKVEFEIFGLFVPFKPVVIDTCVPESFDRRSKELFDEALDFKGAPSWELDKHSSNWSTRL